MPPLTIYYPLGGNAFGLTSGAQFAAFKRRLKVSALMHERVILDNGYWMAAGGPAGNFVFRAPPDKVPLEMLRKLQSPRSRHNEVGKLFSLAISKGEANGPFQQIFESPATVSWQATFEPIRAELPHAYPWIEFESFELFPAAKSMADKMAAEAGDDPLLAARFGDGFTRLLVAKTATHSAVLAGLMGAAVSFDSLHRQVMASEVARGRASPVFGQAALVANLPDVRSLTWEQVDAARALPGLPRLRQALAGIEGAARVAAAQGAELDDALQREFQAEYARAVREAQEGWGSVWTSVAVGTAVSLATTPLDPAVGVIGGAVVGTIVEAGRKLVGQERARSTWVVAADELRAMAQRNRGEKS